MDLGKKIKSLRIGAGYTQEELAGKLKISSQAISKWENNICAPDIYVLPQLSVIFGITIDELFNLTTDEKLNRIENMLDIESSLNDNTFNDTRHFLMEELNSNHDTARIYSLLARLYHHRMTSDSVFVSRYSRESMRLNPDKKDCQWLLQLSEGAAITDWNARQHTKTINFYKEQVAKHPDISRNYLELMDNLLLDHRHEEALSYLLKYRSLKNHNEIQVPVYQARIALSQGNHELARQHIQELVTNYPDNWCALFEAGGFYADRCEYDTALTYFDKAFLASKSPRYTDPLTAMALIYEIKGDIAKSIECYKQVLVLLKDDWGFSEGAPVDEINNEIGRLQNLI